MIITLITILIDFLVLVTNDIPYLPLHCLYIAYLTIRLAYYRQPSTYVFSVLKVKEMIELRSMRQPENFPECKICLKAKPSRYYHCRHCQKCIYRLDHHCDFVGNCVGQYNFKVYVHLLVHTLFHTMTVTAITIWNWKDLLSFTSVKALFWFTILPGFFGIYESLRLLLAFKTTVERNQTLIESYKLVRGQKKTNLSSFESYFGQNRIEWLFPTFTT